VAVEEGAEEAQLAVVAAVEFQAFEALGCVVEGGGGGGEGEGAVGEEGGGRPAGGEAPGAGYHVVGAAVGERQLVTEGLGVRRELLKGRAGSGRLRTPPLRLLLHCRARGRAWGSGCV